MDKELKAKEFLLKDEVLEGVSGGADQVDTYAPYHINPDQCIGCGFCTQYCPAGAIYDDYYIYYIEADQCLSCGMCAYACPTSAISQY